MCALGVLTASDGGQNRLGKIRPAIGQGVADRRIIIDVTGHEFPPIAH
jgi:hypothetical protein